MTKVLVSAKPNILSNEGMILCQIDNTLSLGQIADKLCMTPEARSCLIIQIDGRVVAPAMWDRCFPKDGVRIDLAPEYRGGDSGKQIMGLVAMVALAFLAPGIGVGLANVLVWGGSATLATAISAGVMMIGALAIGALFAPPDQETHGAGEYYSLASVANRARPDGAMMRIYGRLKVFPDVIALPYITSKNGKEYLSVMYGYGYGNVDREDTYIGVVHADDMEPPKAHVINRNWSAGDKLFIYENDVHQEALTLTLMNDRPDPNGVWKPPEADQWRVIKTEKACDKVGIHFFCPEGMWMADPSKSSGMDKAEIAVWIFYRLVGTTPWLNFRTREVPGNMEIDFPLGASKPQAVEWRSDAVNGDRIWIKMKTPTPFNISILAEMPARGQYEFKIGRNDYPGGDPTIEVQKDHTRIVIRALQTITFEPPLAPEVPISMTERRFLASNQLSGSVDNLSSICTAYIPYIKNGVWIRPVWTKDLSLPRNGSWDYPFTNNPAWIYLDILKGTSNRSPLTDDDIDLDAFIAWAKYCDTPSPDDPTKPFLACNFVHTAFETVDQVLQKVAACGNASRHIRDGLHSVIWDAGAPHATQVFTPRNASNFRFVKNFVELPHGIKVIFNNEENDYKEETLIVYSPGYDASSASVFESMKAFGSTETNQAKRAGLRYLAMGRYRFEEFSFSSDIEHLASERGDRIKVSFESVVEGGVVGRVMSVQTNSGGEVTAVALDQKHGGTVIDPAKPVGLMLRTLEMAGSVKQPRITTELVSAFIDDYTVQFKNPLTLAVEKGDMAVFGEVEEITDNYLIMTVTPGPDMTADLLVTPYAEEMQYISNGGLTPDPVP